jgi:hypothetical protein
MLGYCSSDFRPWKWRAVSQKIATFITTAVETSDPTELIWFPESLNLIKDETCLLLFMCDSSKLHWLLPVQGRFLKWRIEWRSYRAPAIVINRTLINRAFNKQWLSENELLGVALAHARSRPIVSSCCSVCVVTALWSCRPGQSNYVTQSTEWCAFVTTKLT